MPTDRVLIEIVTAANMAGIEQANKGMLGMNVSTVALGAALGALVFMGKSAVDNYEKQSKAQLSLKQAADATGGSFNDLQKQFEGWAQANKGYIANQYDAETALANATRAGNNQADAMRILNESLDLAVIKGEDVTSAEKSIELALMGNGRALKELGISAVEYSAIEKSTMTDAQKHAAILDLIGSKTEGGRKTTTDLSRAEQTLNQDWQDLTSKAGPGLVGILAGVVGKLDEAYDALVRIGKDDALWATISARMVSWGEWIREYILNPLDAAVADLYEIAAGHPAGPVKDIPGASRVPNPAGIKIPPGYKAAGGYEGMVTSPTLFMAGEAGSEYVSVTPHGGRSGGNVNITINTMVADGPSLDRFANQIAQRLSYTTGR